MVLKPINNAGEEVWNRILHGEKHLSDKEAEEMKKFIEELRKEKWF